MAATIAETAETRILAGTMQDVFEETRLFRWEVDGAATDAYIEALLDDLEVVTNVALLDVTVTDRYAVSGLNATATNALERVITAVMPLEFEGANPVNPSRPFNKVIKLRAPVSAIVELDGSIVSGIAPDIDAVGVTVVDRLNRITGFFEDFSVGRPSETDPIVVGGFSYTGEGYFYTETGVMNGSQSD